MRPSSCSCGFTLQLHWQARRQVGVISCMTAWLPPTALLRNARQAGCLTFRLPMPCA